MDQKRLEPVFGVDDNALSLGFKIEIVGGIFAVGQKVGRFAFQRIQKGGKAGGNTDNGMLRKRSLSVPVLHGQVEAWRGKTAGDRGHEKKERAFSFLKKGGAFVAGPHQSSAGAQKVSKIGACLLCVFFSDEIPDHKYASK